MLSSKVQCLSSFHSKSGVCLSQTETVSHSETATVSVNFTAMCELLAYLIVASFSRGIGKLISYFLSRTTLKKSKSKNKNNPYLIGYVRAGQLCREGKETKKIHSYARYYLCIIIPHMSMNSEKVWQDETDLVSRAPK